MDSAKSFNDAMAQVTASCDALDALRVVSLLLERRAAQGWIGVHEALREPEEVERARRNLSSIEEAIRVATGLAPELPSRMEGMIAAVPAPEATDQLPILPTKEAMEDRAS